MRRPLFLLAVVAASCVGLLLVAVLARVLEPRGALSRIAPATATASTSEPTPLPSPGVPSLASEPAAVESPAEEIKARAAASATLRGALVNILCIVPSDSPFRSITASGVIVTPSGYILTSAHVAAYFLLADRGVTCAIRTGSPATSAYTASVAYIPPEWIANDAQLLREEAPLETGEYDFALLAITGSASALGVPSVFPSIPLVRSEAPIGAPVVVGSYGAQGLSTSVIENALAPTVAPGSIAQLFTFATTTPDALTVGGSVAAEEGSSGGGVATLDGALAGLITTSSNSGTIASRTLSALTASYLRREYAAETGSSLASLLATAPAAAVAAFAAEASALESILLATAHS